MKKELTYFKEGDWVILDENAHLVGEIVSAYLKYYRIPRQVTVNVYGEVKVDRGGGCLNAHNGYFKYYCEIEYEDVI